MGTAIAPVDSQQRFPADRGAALATGPARSGWAENAAPGYMRRDHILSPRVDCYMKLYFSRNPNPRLAVAVARHLEAKIELEYASPFSPGEAEKFRPLNPNLCLPILVERGKSLWEADAIACRLSRVAGSGFWRSGDEEPEMIRWLSWGKENFVRACDMVHFERGTRRRYDLGNIDPRRIEEGLARFGDACLILDAVFGEREFLVGETASYADFRMATFLPFNDVALLPLETFPRVLAWYSRLDAMPAWTNPFEGLNAPPLPEIPRMPEGPAQSSRPFGATRK